jgi:hypothetical protein
MHSELHVLDLGHSHLGMQTNGTGWGWRSQPHTLWQLRPAPCCSLEQHQAGFVSPAAACVEIRCLMYCMHCCPAGLLLPRAVGLGASGAVYFGANLEFPGNPLSQSVSTSTHTHSAAAWRQSGPGPG